MPFRIPRHLVPAIAPRTGIAAFFADLANGQKASPLQPLPDRPGSPADRRPVLDAVQGLGLVANRCREVFFLRHARCPPNTANPDKMTFGLTARPSHGEKGDVPRHLP